LEKQLIRKNWNHVQKRLLQKWGHMLDDGDLTSGMGYDDLVELLEDVCDISPQRARKELGLILDELKAPQTDPWELQEAADSGWRSRRSNDRRD
jgi:hypothetical protein